VDEHYTMLFEEGFAHAGCGCLMSLNKPSDHKLLPERVQSNGSSRSSKKTLLEDSTILEVSCPNRGPGKMCICP